MKVVEEFVQSIRYSLADLDTTVIEDRDRLIALEKAAYSLALAINYQRQHYGCVISGKLLAGKSYLDASDLKMKEALNSFSNNLGVAISTEKVQ